MSEKLRNELSVFNNNEFGKIRVIMIDNDPWFVGKDVADCLGYSNPQKAIRDHVRDKNKTVNDSFIVNGTKGLLINEPGLYALIMRSKLPTAEMFQDWVYEEVLPSIRKTGSYSVKETPSYLIEDRIERAKQWIKEQEQMQMLEETVKEQTEQIEEMKPKATYFDIVLSCKESVTSTVIAKDFGGAAQTFNKVMNLIKVSYKKGKQWHVYEKYQEQGLTTSKTHIVTGEDGVTRAYTNTEWTQKGRYKIYEILKNKYNLLPVIERTSENNKTLKQLLKELESKNYDN